MLRYTALLQLAAAEPTAEQCSNFHACMKDKDTRPEDAAHAANLTECAQKLDGDQTFIDTCTAQHKSSTGKGESSMKGEKPSMGEKEESSGKDEWDKEMKDGQWGDKEESQFGGKRGFGKEGEPCDEDKTGSSGEQWNKPNDMMRGSGKEGSWAGDKKSNGGMSGDKDTMQKDGSTQKDKSSFMSGSGMKDSKQALEPGTAVSGEARQSSSRSTKTVQDANGNVVTLEGTTRASETNNTSTSDAKSVVAGSVLALCGFVALL